ncbi:hypothetical protein FRB90_001596 [Tulasnella sp. 427]|nr:hypothetical protein FRB90_001596 [Tulasnella sp. 427]
MKSDRFESNKIQDMLEGVVYLHTRDPPICHGDLKSLNILVNASYRAVITDFGSARAVKESTQLEDIEPLQDFEARIEASAIDSVTDLTLTEREYSSRWAAPEVLMGKQANLASDIWAAAWTIWEILTDEFPFSQTNSEGVITLNIIDGKVPQSIRGEQMSQIRSLFRLMMTCWKPDPIKRPSAGACLAEVRRLPSVVPSIPTFFGIKIRSTGIISTPAHIRYLTSDFKRARSILRDALSVARSKEDQLAVANVSFSLGRAYRTRGEYRLAEEAFIHAQVYYASAGNSAGRARAFDELGSVYRAQCQYSVAEGSYLRARKIYTCLKDHLGRASTLCGLGDVYRARCKYEEAEELYQEARGIYARIGEDRGRANVLLGLGEMYSARSRYRKAEETLLHARDIFTSLRDNFGCANALNGLGDVYRAQCRYDEAERSYRSAQVLHHASGDDLGRANALLGLGEVYHARGKHREAATKFTQAHAICDQIGNDTDRLNTLLGLGNIYSTQRKYKTAEKFFNQALNLAARTDNDLGRANALRGLGNVQHAQHQDAQAEYSFGPALDLYERVGNDLGCADALLGLGLAYQAQTKWDEAEESFSQAQYIYAAVRNDVGRANALSGLADVYHALGLYSDAEESFRQARALYAGLGDEMGEANALLGVGEACVAQNKYKEAKEAFTTAEALYRKRGSDASRANVLRALDLLPHDRGSTEAEDADIISPRYLPSPFQDRGGGGKTGGTKAATDAVRGEICRDIRAIGVLPGEQRYKKGPDIASSLPKCGSSSFDSHADGEADGVQSPHGEPPVPTDRPPTIVQRGSKSSLRCCPYPGAQPELK